MLGLMERMEGKGKIQVRLAQVGGSSMVEEERKMKERENNTGRGACTLPALGMCTHPLDEEDGIETYLGLWRFAPFGFALCLLAT